MRKIEPLFSHVNLQYKLAKKPDWGKPVKLDQILGAPPKTVSNYDELVRDIAQILHYNRNLTLFYRGQHTERQFKGKTQLLPSIYRKFPGEKKLMLKERFLVLEEKAECLREKLAVQDKKLAGTSLVYKYPEIAWSILQHYQVCATPLLDLTHSLHVACSFAFDGNKGKTGMIYVLGMPWANDAIGYNTYEELMNIRLLSICPPQAQRPFFQEGYLACHFPSYRMDSPERVDQFDVARRLIAKFEIPVRDSFWGQDFKPIPHAKLYQGDDIVDKICKGLS